MSDLSKQIRPPRIGRWLVCTAGLAVLFGVVLWVSLPRQDMHFARDPRFVVTTKPKSGVPRGASLGWRVFYWCLELQQRLRGPRPLAWSFPASPPTRCSIHGLLNQCMEVSGVRYVIARDVAAGSVQFGATNTLNGAQWVRAFTQALEGGQPEWWDSRTKAFRKENLVLVTNGPRTVLVLPKEMVREFQPDPRE